MSATTTHQKPSLSLFRELKRRNVFKVAAAFLFREERFHDFNQRPEALNHAMSSARKAIEIDPLNQNAYYALAFIYFDLGISKLDEFFLAANRAIEHNPNNSRVIGGMGALIAFAGEWERGIA